MEDKLDGKLNIAMFGHKRIPSREGGIEVVVAELSVPWATASPASTAPVTM